MSLRISVTIPTMGRDTLTHTLRSLEKQTVMPHEVLVINQGSPDVELRGPFDLPITYLHQDDKGLSKARNRALDSFTGDWLLFTDDDQEVNAEWIEQLGILASAYPEVSMIGGPVFPPPRYNQKAEFVSQMYVHGEVVIDKENYLAPSTVPFVRNDIWGGNFALSRDCIEKIGHYDEAFGRGSGVFDVGEDTDYTMRVFSAGLKGLLSCRLIIYHTYGGRPYTAQMTSDTVEVAAALAWKATRSSSVIDPDLARRIFPFGRKKVVLNKLTGGVAFADHAKSKAIYDETMDRLSRDWTLEGSSLKPKAPHA